MIGELPINMNSTEYGSELNFFMTTETPLTTYTWSEVVILSVVVVSLIIVIVVGNAVVVGLVVANRRMRPVQNLFIASLAVSDLSVGLLIMPFSLANELMGYWCFGTVLCELWLAFDVLSCTASILNLCLISVDRYLCITRAMTYPRWRDKNKCYIMIGVVWLMAMLVCLPPLAGWKRPQPTKNGLPLCVLSSEVGYIIYSTLGSFFVPLIVMVAVYIQIYRAVKHQVRRRFSVRYDVPQTAMRNIPQQEEIRRFIPHNEVCDQGEPVGVQGEMEELEMDDVDYQARDYPDKQDTDDQGTYPTLTDDDKCTTEEDDVPPVDLLPYDNATAGLTDTINQVTFIEDTPPSTHLPGCSIINPINEHMISDSYPDTNESKDLIPTEDLKDASRKDVKFESYGVKNQDAKDEACVVVGRANTEHGKSHPKSILLRVTPTTPINDSNPMTSGSENESNTPTTTTTMSPKMSYNNNSNQNSHQSLNRTKKLNNMSPQQSYAVVRILRSRTRKLNFFHYFHDKRGKKIPLLQKDCLTEMHEQKKWRIARARERRLTLILGVIMAAFIVCWFPFFSTYLVSSLTGFHVHKTVFDVFFWAGYCNSALNPIIYTIFNRDIRLCKSR